MTAALPLACPLISFAAALDANDATDADDVIDVDVMSKEFRFSLLPRLLPFRRSAPGEAPFKGKMVDAEDITAAFASEIRSSEPVYLK